VLRRYATIDSINLVGARGAIAALHDDKYIEHAISLNADARQEFINQATARQLKPIDSHANFVMFDAHLPADNVIAHFRKYNVLIGPRFSAMPTHVRVSLGTPSQMQEFWRVWDMLPHHDMPM